jgi:hypothetical protein
MGKKNYFYKFATTFSLVIILMSSCSESDKREDINKNQERGELIINALYIYKQAQGTFPDTLNDLAPNYLNEIPKTVEGQDYFYVTNSVDGFFISFDVEDRFGCGYTDKLKEWECSYGD